MKDAATVACDLVEHASAVFGLSPLERTIIDALLDAIVGASPGHSITAGVLAVQTKLDPSQVTAALNATAKLLRYGLVTLAGSGPILSRTIALDDDFWPRLLGAPIVGVMSPSLVELRTLASLVLSARNADAARTATSWLKRRHGRWPAVVVQGSIGSGRGAVAEALASALESGLFPCDGRELTVASLPTWRRELTWHQAVPVVSNADQADPSALAALSRTFEGPLVLTCSAPLAAQLISTGRAVHLLELEPPTSIERAAMWNQELSSVGADVDSIDTGYLGRRFRLGPARIRDAVSSLTSAVTNASAIALCRAAPELHVGGLANRLPPAEWSDLVIPPAIEAELSLIAAWGKHDDASAGLACLFHGTPGTGKTLAARVIGGALGRDVYRTDLSQVLDRYLGESEKRLDQLFREAEAAGAILFFDEADALFAQRTSVKEARDRYANVETSFLLQRLEQHAGLTILATNLKANLDVAFQRRLGIVVEFFQPQADQRRMLWNKFIAATGARVDDADLEVLVGAGDLTGGDIRNAVIGADLIAKSRGDAVAMEHFVLGVWRELKKAGRLVDPSVLGSWQSALTVNSRATA